MIQMIKPLISIVTAFSMMFGSAGFPAGASDKSNEATDKNKIITIPCGMVNCYLIIGENQCVLVDTGGANSRKKVYDTVKNYNVTLIVLTHGHYDHTQNAAYLAKLFNAKIAMSADDYDLIENPGAHKTYGNTLVQKISSFFSTTMSSLIKIDSFVPNFFFTRCQSLAEFGVNGTIVELKGHTKGSIGVLLNNGRDFIVGDAKMNFLGMSEPFLFEDYNALKASMETIENSGATNIYPGHGQPYT